MKKRILAFSLLLIALFANALTDSDQSKMNFKCLIQLTNYGGEGAYVILSLINPDGEYEQTLSVSGDDEEWYEDMPSWYKFHTETKEDIDGITGESITSGGRRVTVLGVDSSKMNAGYKLRFETAVEDKEYYSQDLEIDLTESTVKQRLKGTGYIRYVKLIQQ